MKTNRRWGAPLIPLLALVLLQLGACDRTPELPGDHKLVVIGFDAADWAEIDPLVEQGRLPAMADFMAESAYGVNMSFVPLQKSPMIWASMATGLMPSVHGIGGFQSDDEERLTSARDWRAPAFWHLAVETGRSACVIGWWATYPATTYGGVVVGDVHTYTMQGMRNPRGLVRPDSLRPDLEALVVEPGDVTLEQLGRFVDLEAAAGHEAVLAEKLDDLRAILAGDLTYLNMARHLAGTADHDVFSVYFRGLDVVCHKFWHYRHPESVHREFPPHEMAAFAGVVPAYYEFCDELLAQLLALFPSDRSVVIMSDHGFRTEKLPRGMRGGGVHAHRPEGMIALRSPIHEPGLRFEQTKIIDVAPTLLALMGLPPSAEMPGVIELAGMTGHGLRFAERLESHRVPSYASFAPAYEDTFETDTEMDEAMKQQLRSLGYID